MIDNSLDTDPRKNDPSAEANTITLLHDNNEVSIYAHLKQDSAKVKIGEQVKAGHHIGNIGCSGKYVDFPHLHFGVFRNGLSVEAKLTGMSLKKKGRWKAMDAFVPKENDVVRTD